MNSAEHVDQTMKIWFQALYIRLKVRPMSIILTDDAKIRDVRGASSNEMEC
jgi:hypothetical protein